MTITPNTKAPPVPPCPSWCGRAGRGHRWLQGGAGGRLEVSVTHERRAGAFRAVGGLNPGVKATRFDYFAEGDRRVEVPVPRVWMDHYEMTPAQARKLSDMLIYAAELAETT